MARSPNVQEQAACQGHRTAWQNTNAAPILHARRSQDRPREAPSKSADLQSRLDQLPVGHPSSPYRDDGPASPGAAGPGRLRTPLSPMNSPRPRPTPSAFILAEDKARVGTDGPGLEGLQAHSGTVALPMHLIRCRDAEGRDADGDYGDHGSTPAMRRIEGQLAHGHLAPTPSRMPSRNPTASRKSSRSSSSVSQTKVQMTWQQRFMMEFAIPL